MFVLSGFKVSSFGSLERNPVIFRMMILDWRTAGAKTRTLNPLFRRHDQSNSAATQWVFPDWRDQRATMNWAESRKRFFWEIFGVNPRYWTQNSTRGTGHAPLPP